VASHGETRGLFLGAHIPLFLYPFLNTTSKSRPFEYLRLTSLGVIGALVKNDSSEVINFLLTTEIIPLCLRIMETGSELSKTVAIFIVQKILLDDLGLQYICQTYERFYAVGTVLSNMVNQLVEQQTVRLLKHVVRCFLRYVKFRYVCPSPCLTTTIVSVITLVLVKLFANACPSPFATPPSLLSCVMMPPLSVVWHNCCWHFRTRLSTLRSRPSLLFFPDPTILTTLLFLSNL